MGLDIRLPTGDQLNLLGTGTAGLAPFFILSSTVQRVSPHVDVAYQWNGKSLLAGNPAIGESGAFPGQVTYSAGADIAVTPRVTLAHDSWHEHGTLFPPESFITGAQLTATVTEWAFGDQLPPSVTSWTETTGISWF